MSIAADSLSSQSLSASGAAAETTDLTKMSAKDLVAGPCALPQAALAMPAQQLERETSMVKTLLARLRLPFAGPSSAEIGQ